MAQLARDEAGNVWEVDAQGNPVRLVQSANAPTPVAPPPDAPFRAPQAEADVRRARAQADAEVAKAPFAGPEAEAAARKIEADARLAELQLAAEEAGRVKQTAETREKALKGFQDTHLLDQAIVELEALYQQGPGATSGVYGVQDFFATPENQRFNRAGNQVRAFLKGVLEFTGQENNTPAEALMNFGPYVPQAADFDGTIRDKINALKRLRDSGYQRAVQQLGGVPTVTGQVVPLPQGALPTRDVINALARGEEPEQVSAFDVLRTTGGAGPATTVAPRADVGGGGTISEDYPPALIAAHDDMVRTLVSQGGGRINPQAYANAKAALGREFGFQFDPQEDARWATSVNDYLDAGGRTIPSGITPVERQMTATETMRNNLVNNPVGGFVSGAGNMATLGAIEAALPGQYQALGDAQGGFQTAGEIAGAIGSTMAMGGAGRVAAGRFAPSLLGGGARGQFMRNVATDTAFGGAVGGVTEGDPLTGAALGSLGSVGGQGVARGIGAGIGGMQRTAAAEALRNRGVPVSVARQVGMGPVEDIMQSLPFAGQAARNRQAESFVGFNDAAFDLAAEPTARLSNPFRAPVMGQGREGLGRLEGVEGQAFDAALGGVNVPIDTQFFRDLRPVNQAIRALPSDYRNAAESIVQRRVEPAVANRQMTGREYQQAIRGLRQARANAGSNPNLAGFDQEYRDALTGIEDLLTGAVERGAGRRVIDDLATANEIYSNRRILENATLDRAKVGTRTGEVNVFTPSQLLEAARQAESRYGSGEALRQFGVQGQQVLPSTLPNSGTADRLIAAGLIGGSAGVGGAANYNPEAGAQSAAEGAGTYAGNLTAASLILGALGTRRGQEALERILITRPQAAQRVGQGFRRRAGLFGSAAVPIALEAQ